MRLVIFGTAFALSLAGCVSLQPIKDEDRTFSEVFEAPGASQAEIFSTTKIWIAENFHSAKAVIEYENEEQGTLIGNGIISYPCSGLDCLAKNDWRIPFTMRVDMKDERFKLTFSNLRLTWPPSSSGAAHDGPLHSRGDIERARQVLLKFGDQLAAAITEEGASSDW